MDVTSVVVEGAVEGHERGDTLRSELLLGEVADYGRPVIRVIGTALV